MILDKLKRQNQGLLQEISEAFHGVFKDSRGVQDCFGELQEIAGVPGVSGTMQGVQGRFRGVTGRFWDVTGVFKWIPRCFRGVSEDVREFLEFQRCSRDFNGAQKV